MQPNFQRLTLSLISLLIHVSAISSALAASGDLNNDFEDGGTIGWQHGGSPNPPTVVAAQMGDPAFVGNFSLQNESSGAGFAGGRFAMFNTLQWDGDYRWAGILAIRADVSVDPGSDSDLSLRVGFQHLVQSMAIGIVSKDPVVVPKDGNWYEVTLPIAPDDFVSVGGNLIPHNEILANTAQLRIISSAAGNDFRGDRMVATARFDNIRAITAPISECDGSALCSLPDINGNGFAELAVVVPGGSSHVHVRDGDSGNLIRDIDYGDDPVSGMAVVRDVSGNDMPEIALLGTRPDNNIRVQVKDSFTGDTVNNIFYGKAYSALDLVSVPDVNFNDIDELAVLGASVTGGVRIQARDILSDAASSTTYYGSNVTPINIVSLPDISGNGTNEILMHGQVIASGQGRAQWRDSLFEFPIRNTFFGNVFTPIRLFELGDLTGDGIADTAQLARRDDTGAVRIQFRNSWTGSVSANAFTGSDSEPITLVAIGSAELAFPEPDVALLVKEQDGGAKVVVRSGQTGNFIRNIFVGAVSNPVAMVLVEDLDGSGDPELAILGDDGAGTRRVQIKDSISGAQINTIDYTLQ